MGQIKLYPVRVGGLIKEAYLNTKESDMINASYELRYNSTLKWNEIRFFVPFGEQIGRWTAVGFWYWEGDRRIQSLCIHYTGCYTVWMMAGKNDDDLDLEGAYYFYQKLQK